MYLAGIIGLQNKITRPLFLQLTAFNLWVSVSLLLFFHQKFTKKVSFILCSIFILGYFVEVLGVKTGQIFGSYSYGSSLGFKIFDVPVSIGANWLLLCYCFSYFFSKYFSLNYITNACLSSICMVLLDYLIEPVAIKFDFWSWQNNIIPIQNYLAWLAISYIFNLVLLKLNIFFKNNIAPLLLLLQILFFTIHNIFIFLEK